MAAIDKIYDTQAQFDEFKALPKPTNIPSMEDKIIYSDISIDMPMYTPKTREK